MKTAARKWSETHRPATPECDLLEAEYHSKMSTRLRIWGLARRLESQRNEYLQLVDRAYKMMELAGYKIATQDSEHSNPVIAWMSDARSCGVPLA